MAGRRIFGGVAIEGCFKIFKPVAELNNVAVISELYNIQQIELNVFIICN
jgi:hypothetical protein